MSKIAYLTRYSLILKKLQKQVYSNYEEILSYINREMEYLRQQDEDLDIGFSKRTLQRDIKEIRNIIGIEIRHSRKLGGYYIASGQEGGSTFQRMLEAFDTFNIFKISEDVSPYIHLEQRHSGGTENLNAMLHAIKIRKQVTFIHKKFWEENSSHRLVAPFGLKEFRNRWYLVGEDYKDHHIKTFALDRISDFQILNRKIETDKKADLQELFRYSFGVILETKETPQEIILSFTPFQAPYIKSLPLHPNQEILEDNDKGLKIKLQLYITYDLIMELLSFGGEMEVVKPVKLRKKLKELHSTAIKKNQ